MSVVVERALDFFGPAGIERDAVLVQVFSPQQEKRGDWRCQYRVAWPGHEINLGAFGVDAWQALQLAMYIVPTQIAVTEDCKNGRIGLWGKPISTHDAMCELFGVKRFEGPKQ